MVIFSELTGQPNMSGERDVRRIGAHPPRPVGGYTFV